MEKAFIFCYAGHLGVVIPKTLPFINDPFAPGQLGCVISTKDIKVTQEAKDFIRSNFKRASGSFASTMFTKHNVVTPEHGKSSIAFLKGPGERYLGKQIEIGRDCELSVLDDCELVDEPVPGDFMYFVDFSQ